MSLSAHLVADYEKSPQNKRSMEQNIVQSGAMEYNSLAHGSSSFGPQKISLFSQFSQASLGPAYAADTSISMAGPSNMALTRSDASISFQQLQALQQQREEAQALRTIQAVATLQAKLNQRLGPEYISQRPGPGNGSKLTYVEGWKVINLANEVFGFNGWSSSITSLTTDYIDYNQETQRYNVGVTATTRIVLRDGVSHEDVGYGLVENCKSKGMALDKCKKEAVTDALKRTLRSFGNVLGNCLYDKEYTREIMKLKMPPPLKLDPEDLHRRKEFVTGGPIGPIGNGKNKAHPPMAPPPVPQRPPPQSAQKPSEMQPKPPICVFPTPEKATSLPKPIANPSNTSTGPSKPTTPTFALERSGTEESLYAMGSDDDTLFADLSINSAEAVELEGSPHLLRVDCTDRSRPPPSTASTLRPLPPSATSPAAPSATKPPIQQNEQPSRKRHTETKKILEGLLDSHPPPIAPKSADAMDSKGLKPPAFAPKPAGSGNLSKILEGLIDPLPPALKIPSSTTTTMPATSTATAAAAAAMATTTPSSLKPRASSGGRFVIPPGVARPQRAAFPPLPSPLPLQSHRNSGSHGRMSGNESGLGTKRKSEALGFAEGKVAPSVGSTDSVRSILGDLEVGQGGSVKRPRLS